MVGIPISTAGWPGLWIDIEAGSLAMEGKGGRPTEQGQPRGLICGSKPLPQLTLGVQLIVALLGGPDERVKRDSGHMAFLLYTLFPTAVLFLPTPRSIPKQEPTGKEHPDFRRSYLLEALSQTMSLSYGNHVSPRRVARSTGANLFL